MKHNRNTMILATGALLLLSFAGAPALAQHEHHGGQKPAPKQEQKPGPQHQGHDLAGHGMTDMMQEPHHLLAMAYHEGMAAFAKTLSKQAGQTSALNAEFARDAVAEIRRNFDQMMRHHQEHTQAMSAAARAQMDAMIKQMEPHHIKMKVQLEALERETGGDQIDRQRVAQHAAELIKHFDQMSGMHGAHAQAGHGAHTAAPSPSSQHDHHAAVNQRGDQVMGFAHAKTTHHFRLKSDGGIIEVEANDPADIASRDQIRDHLKQIAQKFAAGDFTAPMLIHAQTPPGVPVLKQLKATLKYQLETTVRGARIRITTSDKKALAAVHDFLRFQIADHQTGDSSEVEKTP